MRLIDISVFIPKKHEDEFFDKCAEIFDLPESVTALRTSLKEHTYATLIAEICFGIDVTTPIMPGITLCGYTYNEKANKPEVWKREIWERLAPCIGAASVIRINDDGGEIHWTFRNGKLIDHSGKIRVYHAWNIFGNKIDPTLNVPDSFYVEDKEDLNDISRLVATHYDLDVVTDLDVITDNNGMTFPELYVRLENTFWPVSTLEERCFNTKRFANIL